MQTICCIGNVACLHNTWPKQLCGCVGGRLAMIYIQFSCYQYIYLSYLQCQMRSTVHSSQLKESLLEVFKQSTQTSEHKIDDLEESVQFYNRFYKNKKLQVCQISHIEIVSSSFWRSYAVYTIKIVTSDLEYTVKRRFSDFEQFYYKNKVDCYLDVKLPPKTFFKVGWAEDVTKQRTIQLNSLIHKILSSENYEMHCALYQFLEIFQRYSQEGLIESEEKAYEPDTFVSDGDLIEKINRLKFQPANSLAIIRQIKYCLFERKKRISYEMAKQFLLGYGSNEGFISLIMKNPNQIVVLEGLQMLVDLLSPQTNKDCEMFTKVLSRCTSSQLILAEYDPTLPHCIFKLAYFQFLRLYRQTRGEEAVLEVMTNYENEKELRRQYASWQKLQRLEGRG